MMEKLGQAKTHLELKKMIAEVDTTNSGPKRDDVKAARLRASLVQIPRGRGLFGQHQELQPLGT